MEATVEETGRAGERGTASENDALHDILAQSVPSHHSNEQLNTHHFPFSCSHRTFFASLAHFANPAYGESYGAYVHNRYYSMRRIQATR